MLERQTSGNVRDQSRDITWTSATQHLLLDRSSAPLWSSYCIRARSRAGCILSLAGRTSAKYTQQRGHPLCAGIDARSFSSVKTTAGEHSRAVEPLPKQTLETAKWLHLDHVSLLHFRQVALCFQAPDLVGNGRRFLPSGVVCLLLAPSDLFFFPSMHQKHQSVTN